jgi:hypothetical protein
MRSLRMLVWLMRCGRIVKTHTMCVLLFLDEKHT